LKDIERRLLELGRSFDDPDSPQLANRVGARLRARRHTFKWRSRRAVAVAAAGLAVVGAVAASPARTALLDLLDVGGVEVRRVESLSSVPPRGRLAPGVETTLAQALAGVEFPVYVPEDSSEPDRVFYYGADPPGGEVTLVYGSLARPRLLVSEFVASDLGPVKFKQAGPKTTVERTDVDGEPAIWLGGATHQFSFVDGDGMTRGFQTRLAGNTLVWVRDGVTIRLEGDVSRGEAIDLAESFVDSR
jgi:hypothetical protein